ncbi:hypothetical protein [Pseudomonas kilonensis]
MRYSPLYISVILLGVVWALYFSQFNAGFSSSQGDWGTFGDFTGGVLNPLLNFITIYLLITQYIQSRSESKAQAHADEIKTFEGSFFTFVTIALNEYKSYEIIENGVTYKGAAAIGFIQAQIVSASKSATPLYDTINNLDEKYNDSIYSLVSSFCVIFKLIEDSCPLDAKDRYVSTLSMLLPTKVTYLMCIAEALTKWKIMVHPRKLNYFTKPSVAKVISYFNQISGSN